MNVKTHYLVSESKEHLNFQYSNFLMSVVLYLIELLVKIYRRDTNLHYLMVGKTIKNLGSRK